jgi:hypothetical protein
MCVAGGVLSHRDRLELDLLVADLIEHPLAASEQHRHQVDRDLVDQAGPDELAAQVGAAHHRDCLLAGGLHRLLQRGIDSAGHERVDAVLGTVLRLAVRDHEHRHPGGPGRPVRSPPWPPEPPPVGQLVAG